MGEKLYDITTLGKNAYKNCYYEVLKLIAKIFDLRNKTAFFLMTSLLRGLNCVPNCVHISNH